MFTKTHENAKILTEKLKVSRKQLFLNKPSLETVYSSTVVYGGDILGFHFFAALNDKIPACSFSCSFYTLTDILIF